MPIFSAENFKYGLDGRRNPLSMAPGSLVELTNGHITSGGEVEKRKEFLWSALPANCYGLEVTGYGLTTFSSSYTEGYVTLTSGVVLYVQRLAHPAYTLAGDNSFALVGVLRSTSFNRNAFVLAQWSNGSETQYLCHYAGNVIWQTVAGKVTTGMRNCQHKVLYQLFGDLYTSGWARYLEPAKQDAKLYAPVGVTGVASVSRTSAEGELRCVTNNPVASNAAYGPSFEFQVTSSCTDSSLSLKVYKEEPGGDTLWVTLFSYSSNLSGATAADVQATLFAKLNEYPYHWSGKAAEDNFEFQLSGTSIKVKAPASWASETYKYQFSNGGSTTNPSLTNVTSASPFLTITPSPVVCEAYSNYTSATAFTTAEVTAVPSIGGTYTDFTWTPTNPSSGITVVDTATAAGLTAYSKVKFQATLLPGQTLTDTYDVSVLKGTDIFSVSVFVSISNLGRYVSEENTRPDQQIP